MRIALDIETNLAHTKIWCCVTKDLDTKEVKVWKEANELWEYIKEASLIVAHNGIGFDFKLLNKLWNCRIQLKTVQDTLTLSRLLNPSREGGHSLAAWGETLGYPKTEFNDFELETHTLDEMIEYCINDVEVLAKLYNHLVTTLQSEKFSQRSIDLEHQVQAIITKQEEAGFKLDEPKALQLLAELKSKLDVIQTEMQSIFPAKVTSGRTHKTTGKPLRDIIEPFNPGSRQQIAERLIEKGWKPTKHTEKGSVIVDEAVLATLDFPEAKTLAEYMMLQKRIGQIESWLDSLKSDGRVHGRVITNGAVTGRMTHMSPNMAQVPNSGSPYGHECRELWIVEKGNALVGIDASGLELRMLAHYMNDNEYTHEVVSGDIHTANQKAAGLETRNQAKTFIYAFLYGAGASKIGSVVGGSAKEGQRLIDSFLHNTPKLKALREKVGRIYLEKGKVPGLDGRQLLIRSEHSALNTLLQGAGAIVMKQALIIFDKKLKRLKMQYKFVANVHDEWQIEVPWTFAEQVGRLGVESIEEAGKVLEMRCPLTGEFKYGNNWKETH
jgi:DNA polymerase I-like protein with 3'-5' exonuclease and polymerase domains